MLGILRVHEFHLQNQDHFPKKDFTALESGETRSRREEKKNSSKAPTVQMVESDDSDNSFGDSTDDEVALMSRGFK